MAADLVGHGPVTWASNPASAGHSRQSASPVGKLPKRAIGPWLALVPSPVTISFRRSADGLAVIAVGKHRVGDARRDRSGQRPRHSCSRCTGSRTIGRGMRRGADVGVVLVGVLSAPQGTARGGSEVCGPVRQGLAQHGGPVTAGPTRTKVGLPIGSKVTKVHIC